MIGIIITIILLIILLSGFRIVRPTHRMLVETFGKYSRTAEQGLRYLVPFVQKGRYVNITEQMVDVPPQMVTTSDKLNMKVDAVVYYKVKDVKAAEYNVDGHKQQLTSLARTTLRAVMGDMNLQQCIQKRDQINQRVEKVLDKETDAYGVEVLRVEVQRIEPPQDVQESMNNVVKAEQDKIAAQDLATATETKADGERRAAIKKAEGIAKGKIIVADAEAYKIKIVNESARKHFKDNAQKLKKLQVTENSLKENAKIILTTKGINPQLLIGDLPIRK